MTEAAVLAAIVRDAPSLDTMEGIDLLEATERLAFEAAIFAAKDDDDAEVVDVGTTPSTSQAAEEEQQDYLRGGDARRVFSS